MQEQGHRGQQWEPVVVVFIEYHTYHSMKGKKEDDDSRPKPINESTRVNHFANLLVHVELEQLSNYVRIQPESVKEEGRT